MKIGGEARLLLIMGLFVLFGGGALVLMGRGSGTDGDPGQKPTPTPTPQAWTPARFDALVKDTRHVRGDANARFTVVEFADFQCPSCRRAYNSLLVNLEGKAPMRYIFRHYPLPMHEQAVPAALATEAADRQGKFWPLYDALFKGQDTELSPTYIRNQAASIGLDMTRYDKDITDGSLHNQIETDKEAAESNHIDMTPTFIVRDSKTGKITQAVGGQEFDTLLANALGTKPILPPASPAPLPKK